MKKSVLNPRPTLLAAVIGLLALTGCGSVGSTVADVGLAGTGGVAAYKLSDGNVGIAAAGAAAGLIASRVAQAQVNQALTEADRVGFDRAMRQAVKQQYWIIQNQQKSRSGTEEPAARLVPVVIPETKINGTVQAAHVEYLRVQP